MTGRSDSWAADMADKVTKIIETASKNERMVIKHRLTDRPSRTLAAIGTDVGLTKERIRQIETQCRRRIHTALTPNIKDVANELMQGLGQVVEKGALNARMDKAWATQPTLTKGVMHKTLIKQMGFKLDNGMFVGEKAMEDLENMRRIARELSDDVGLVNEKTLIDKLQNTDLLRVWAWAIKQGGLHRLFGSLARCTSARARTKAALIEIGRPATREEISEKTALGTNKTGSHLSVIQSIVRADKDRWGLKEWVADVYDNIVKEIIARIEKDGGRTDVKTLMTEIPEKFLVAASSVRTYTRTAKFEMKDGKISLADKRSVKLRDLDEVIDGRNETGCPYWKFTVSQRNMNGYSITSIPPEFAKAIGCKPESVTRVKIVNLADWTLASMGWHLESTSGVWLGSVSGALKRLGLQAKRKARITIRGNNAIELSADRPQKRKTTREK